MVKEKTLVKTSKWRNFRILQLFNKFLEKFRRSKILYKEFESQQKLNDVDILKSVVDGTTNISELDYDTIKMLINICNNRVEEVNKKIINSDREIFKLENFLINIKEFEE